MVSCVLPTKNRAAYIPQAIQSYQSQTYPTKQLIIVDQGSDQTSSLIPADSSIHYYRASPTLTTGEMRNECAKHAQGEFICHFDSDDWSAPPRVAEQVTRLGTFGVVTGYKSLLFYDVRNGKCYRWHSTAFPTTYVLGTSLCYRKAWWEHHPFPAKRVGEDMHFFKEAIRTAKRLVPVADGGQMMVARVHDHQTCPKALHRVCYQPQPIAALPEKFLCVLT